MTPSELAIPPADKQFYTGYAGAVAKFNNASDHAAVIALFDRAIKSLDGPGTETGMAILRKVADNAAKRLELIGLD